MTYTLKIKDKVFSIEVDREKSKLSLKLMIKKSLLSLKKLMTTSIPLY